MTRGLKFQAQVLREYRATYSRIALSLPLPLGEWELLATADSADQDSDEARTETLSIGEAFQDPVEVRDLVSDTAWELLDATMRFGMVGNPAPWNRIVSVLREHGAACCVVEAAYVCLDHRSEMATYYSQLNTPTSTHSVRLHFFSQQVSLDDYYKLTPAQMKSYLGYVVCRGGNLPLVGRTVIKTPRYIQDCADVEETVYFFGQRLTVFGVPFMQQDERFAVCAQVCAWAANYSAYRRGLVERRLIADFVALSRSYQPMKPTASSGLGVDQVAELIKETGMRAEIWLTPHVNGEAIGPQITPDMVPGAAQLVDRATKLVDDLGELSELRAASSSLQDFAADFQRLAEQYFAENDEMMPLSSKLQDVILRHWALPYIRSRWPIYCQTLDHAILLCGLTLRDNEPVFFFHDDQYGPYLASRYAFLAGKSDFLYQAGLVDQEGVDIDPPWPPAKDLAENVVTGSAEIPDNRRRIHYMVVPVPVRLLLDPAGAEQLALNFIESVDPTFEGEVRVTVTMGTDYKDDRLNQLRQPEPPLLEGEADIKFYSSVALAEWVAVVEGIVDERVVWELVYDGSSGSSFPILQLGRYGASAVYVPPDPSAKPQVLELRQTEFAHVNVPSRLGKGRRVEARDEQC